MANYPGSNDSATLEGNEKQVYASKKKERFKKLKKLCQGK